MIRINLLGRTRPKAQRATVPLEATLQYVLLVAALAVSGGALWVHWGLLDRENTKVAAHIQKQTGEKARLEQLKQQVDNFEKQRAVLQQRIGVIEGLQRNRTGGQELLEAIANTVSRTDTLWLTSVDRKADALTINGSAGSLNAVAADPSASGKLNTPKNPSLACKPVTGTVFPPNLASPPKSRPRGWAAPWRFARSWRCSPDRAGFP